ncbi:uncharacterized protein ColSpa_10021 [Colletotrichum spaethianum]|uniref:Uncharacterized protein n=1 Tax=Colletotrichum spaethianum TaxID=700344 RepID=A0AA37PCY1_9PEZI|nr:uncharacterized protein ColSpa_10021 [Colletotrichum spaethianum]GKT49840.1 hypothetical protein ColSpa_10021 [Colletotrichum spaethianum]
MRNTIFQCPRWHLVQLLFLTSAATATIISVGDISLSLSNFQLITELSVPLGCLLAYNSPIIGCRATDFENSRTCSAKCTRGLTRTQNNVRDACQAVQVQANTILGQALAGNLINLLCDYQAQHNHSAAAPNQHRQPAAAAAATTTTTTLYYFCHFTSATANHHVSDINADTDSASSFPSPSSPSATVGHSSSAGLQPRTTAAAAASAASADNRCHNHDRKQTSTSEHFHKASG